MIHAISSIPVGNKAQVDLLRPTKYSTPKWRFIPEAVVLVFESMEMPKDKSKFGRFKTANGKSWGSTSWPTA
jgi:hypothetical protein